MNIALHKKLIISMLILASISTFGFYNSFIIRSPHITVTEKTDAHAITAAVEQIINEDSTVLQTLHNQLDTEHEQRLRELQNAFPIAQHEWKNLFEELETIKSSDDLRMNVPNGKQTPGEHSLIKQVKEIFASYNINPDRVSISLIHDDNNSKCASAGQGYGDKHVIHELIINSAKMLPRSQAIQHAILRHEIMHLIQYDSLEHSFITSLLQEHGITPQEYYSNAAFLAYCKHKELRADLLAASYNEETRAAFKRDFEDAMIKNPEKYAKEYKTHPSKQQRHIAIAQLEDYIKAEQHMVSA